jgi:hypothetical protein
MTEKNSKEKQEEIQRKEKQREVALINLESSMWNYALPKLITSEQYGKLSEGSKQFYNQTISKTPEQSVYEQLFLSQLNSEGGAITSNYLQTTSAQILQESLLSVKTEDVMKYFKIKNIKESLQDKYINELSEEEMQQIVGSYFQYKTDEKVKEILDLRQKSITKNLEELVSEKQKSEKKK